MEEEQEEPITIILDSGADAAVFAGAKVRMLVEDCRMLKDESSPLLDEEMHEVHLKDLRGVTISTGIAASLTRPCGPSGPAGRQRGHSGCYGH